MSKMIAKAKKKSDAELSLLRIQYAKHLFEIMEGLFLVMEKPEFPAAGATYVTFNDLADVFNEAFINGNPHQHVFPVGQTVPFIREKDIFHFGNRKE